MKLFYVIKRRHGSVKKNISIFFSFLLAESIFSSLLVGACLEGERKKVMQIFPTRMCNVTAWRHSRLRAHWLMALVGVREKYVFFSFLLAFSFFYNICYN